jgi:tRNA 2-selenouridine synthase SelU
MLMKVMCKFKRTDGSEFALKQFDIHRIEAETAHCVIILHDIGADGEWREERHRVIGTLDQVIAEVER